MPVNKLLFPFPCKQLLNKNIQEGFTSKAGIGPVTHCVIDNTNIYLYHSKDIKEIIKTRYNEKRQHN